MKQLNFGVLITKKKKSLTNSETVIVKISNLKKKNDYEKYSAYKNTN